MRTEELASHTREASNPEQGGRPIPRLSDRLREYFYGAVMGLGLSGIMGGAYLAQSATRPSKVDRYYDEQSAVLRVERERLADQWKLYHSNPPYPSLRTEIEEFNTKARGFNSMLDASSGFDYQRKGLLRVIPIDPEKPDMDRHSEGEPDSDRL